MNNIIVRVLMFPFAFLILAYINARIQREIDQYKHCPFTGKWEGNGRRLEDQFTIDLHHFSKYFLSNRWEAYVPKRLEELKDYVDC